MNGAVMAGRVPATHVFGLASLEDVDARDKRGHDDRMKRLCARVGSHRKMLREPLPAFEIVALQL